MFYKIGSGSKILLDQIEARVKRKVTPPVTPNVTPNVKGNVTDVPEPEKTASRRIVEPLDKVNFLYFWSRAISAGETSGPNGNGDYFPLEELIKSYGSFIGRGLFLNHDSDAAEKAVGKIIDAYLITDNDTGEIWVETLSKIDRKAHPDIARKVETGIIDSVSMGCNCQTCVCSVCDQVMYTKDDFCDHMRTGLLRKFNKAGQEIQCYSINKGLNFSELSLVSVPADSKAKIHEVLASLKITASFKKFKEFAASQWEHHPEIKSKIEQSEFIEEIRELYDADPDDFVELLCDYVGFDDKSESSKDTPDLGVKPDICKECGKPQLECQCGKTANLKENQKMDSEKEVKKVAGETDPKQPESKVKTTVDAAAVPERALEPGDAISKAVEKVKTTNDQAELTNVLQKLNALEFMALEDFMHKKAKDMGSEGDVKALERHTDKEYDKGLKKADEIANATKSTPVTEPALKEFKKEVVSRVAEQVKAAGKDGETCPPEKASGEEELAKMRKEILRRVSSKFATRLFQHVLEKEAEAVAGSPEKAKDLLASSTFEFKKTAGAAPDGKEYYYFTKTKEPKPAGIPTSSGAGELYKSKHEDEDVTKIPAGGTTADQEAQAKKPGTKDEWDRAHDALPKQQEKDNKVMNTRKQMGFGEAHTAEFKKAEQAKDSRWIVKNAEGKPVLDFSLEQVFEDQLPKQEKWATSENYGKALIDRIQQVGLKEVAKILKVEPIEVEAASAKDQKVLDALEKLEDLLGIQEKGPEGEEVEKKEKKLSFHDHVLDELSEIQKAVEKLAPKKPADSGKPPMPKAPEKKPESKKDELPKGEPEKNEPPLPSADKKPVLPPMGEKKEKPLFPMPKASLDEAPKVDEKPKEDEKKVEEEKKAAQEPTKVDQKSEREAQLEAELQAERTKSAIREKTMTARALVEEMFERGLIDPDEATVKRAQAEGKSILDSKRDGLVKAFDDQMSDLFKMDDTAFKSFAKSIRGLKKEAAQKRDVLRLAPLMPVDPLKTGKTDEEWLRELPWS